MVSVHREGVTGHGVNSNLWGGRADSDDFFNVDRE